MKTSELTGAALDWAVAKCEGGTDFLHDGISMHFELHGQTKVLATGWAPSMSYTPSTHWSQGGPIIEREIITLSSLYAQKNSPIPEYELGEWGAYISCGAATVGIQSGPTPLIAAMRCYVASKLGNDVEVPEELQ